MKTIHKLKHGIVADTWGCDTDGVQREQAAWRWKDVTCKRCLRRRAKGEK